MTHLIGLSQSPCSMYDACMWPKEQDEITEIFFRNFMDHYRTNRAPFPLFAHSAWHTNDDVRRRAFEEFIDTILEAPDVYIVTSQQLLDWVKDPKPLSRLNELESFDGSRWRRRAAPCKFTDSCATEFVQRKGEIRYMKTCQQCPKRYPWVGNPGGE